MSFLEFIGFRNSFLALVLMNDLRYHSFSFSLVTFCWAMRILFLER